MVSARMDKGTLRDHERCINDRLSQLRYDICFTYLDDVLVYSRTFKDHERCKEGVDLFEIKRCKIKP